MKFALLVSFIAIISVVVSHRYCCSDCIETRNVTYSGYVPDTACPSVIVRESRCIRRGWYGCARFGYVYKKVSPLVLDTGLVREQRFCNVTCASTVCFNG